MHSKQHVRPRYTDANPGHCPNPVGLFRLKSDYSGLHSLGKLHSRSRDAAKATVRNQIDRQADQRLGTTRAQSAENAWTVVAHRARHRRCDRFGNLHRGRHGDRGRKVRHLLDPEHAFAGLPGQPPRLVGPSGSGAGVGVFHRAGGHRLRLYRPLLCRAGVDDSDCRERLHLHLRHHGRTGRLDHRLGSHPGICR
jgi:hypothetical protein